MQYPVHERRPCNNCTLERNVVFRRRSQNHAAAATAGPAPSAGTGLAASLWLFLLDEVGGAHGHVDNIGGISAEMVF
jgi:hypothetical protein